MTAPARPRNSSATSPDPPSSRTTVGRDARGAPVGLAVADARYHLHLLGPTGVGKSTLLARLALADLTAGRAAVVVDPKGDLVEDVLARPSRNRGADRPARPP